MCVAAVLACCPASFVDNEISVDETFCSFSQNCPDLANLANRLYHLIHQKITTEYCDWHPPQSKQQHVTSWVTRCLSLSIYFSCFILYHTRQYLHISSQSRSGNHVFLQMCFFLLHPSFQLAEIMNFCFHIFRSIRLLIRHP